MKLDIEMQLDHLAICLAFPTTAIASQHFFSYDDFDSPALRSAYHVITLHARLHEQAITVPALAHALEERGVAAHTYVAVILADRANEILDAALAAKGDS